MNTLKLCLARPFGDVDVAVERKSVKKIRLKVFPDGSVKLTVPAGAPDELIHKFIASKAPWVEKSLRYYENTRAGELEAGICSGATTRVLGRQARITVKESKTYKVEQRGDHIYIYSPAGADKMALQKQFERWWRKRSKAYFQEAVDRLYPVVAKYGVEKPALFVRKIKTLWGSCSKKLCRINLNYYLYKAPPPCVDYVVLHELAHLLYPRHDKDFYEFLTVHMPDWKERKRILDHEVVRGLGY